MLETPPYFIAIVFVFFLVVTLGFEKVSATSLAMPHAAQLSADSANVMLSLLHLPLRLKRSILW